MKFLEMLLRTPEAQGDPHVWASVLLAHAFICLSLAALMPWWAAVALYSAWEAIQWRKYDADPWDCALDWSAGMLGVCVAVALQTGNGPIGAILALGIVLIVGVRKRA